MSGRTLRKNPTKSKIGQSFAAATNVKNTQRNKAATTKRMMEEVLEKMKSTTDLGRPADGAAAEEAMREDYAAPMGSIIQPARFNYTAEADKGIEELTSAMKKLGGRRRKSRRRHRHRRRTAHR
jgi:hypothetical protein